MGKITIEQIVTVDGYAAEADGGLRFFEAADFGDSSRTDSEQMQWLKGVDAILLGANTYRMFSGFWPDADPTEQAVAEPINRLPKFVVSNSLDSAPWGSEAIEILRGEGTDSAKSLKKRFKSIAVWGSLQLAESLMVANVVDILRLRIVPVLIGNGRSFTPTTLTQHPMMLENVHQHPTGHVTLTYQLK